MSRLSKYLHPRDEIMRTMERSYRYRMTTTSGGNLSIREPDGTVWGRASPTRSPKASTASSLRITASPSEHS